MSQLLQYCYAQVLESGECVGCGTSSYEINHPLYILVSINDNSYVGKWYNREDSTWYLDSGFTQRWDDCPDYQ